MAQISTSGRLLVIRKGNRSLFYRVVYRDSFVAVLQFQTKESIVS